MGISCSRKKNSKNWPVDKLRFNHKLQRLKKGLVILSTTNRAKLDYRSR